MDYDRNDALLHWIFRQTQGDAWFRPNEENISSGVALRVSDHGSTPEFRVFPYENASLEPFETAVAALNPVVAVKVRSAAVHAALAEVAPDEQCVYVDSNTRIQILDTMLMLPTADREQCAAFIRDERVLVIWSESLDRIIPTCNDFEDRLIKLLWRSRPGAPSTVASHTSMNSSAAGSVEGLHMARIGTPSSTPGSATGPGKGQAPRPSMANSSRSNPLVEKPVPETPPSSEEAGMGTRDEEKSSSTPSLHTRTRVKRNWYGKKIGFVTSPPSTPREDKGDLEQGLDSDVEIEERDKRPVQMYAPVYNGLAAGLAFVFIGNGMKIIFQEWTLDASFVRFALFAICPLLFCVSLFFTLQLVQNVSMVIGPIAHFYTNSKYYSAIKPRPNKLVDNDLPHVTIQMPVFKESLETVLTPSIMSIKKAMQTYARQGGTSTIFVNDDGLRLLPPAARDARLAFYANHNIGWVARPKHDSSPEGFKRTGRFKKASNMNYALSLSLKAERHLETLLTNQLQTLNPNRNNTPGRGSMSTTGTSGTIPQVPSQHGSGYGIQYQSQNLPGEDGDEDSAPVPVPASGGNSGNTSNVAIADDGSGRVEEKALQMAIEEVWEESGRRHRPWAANGRATRMGEVLLLVDSDTIVPEDCLRDAAREMRECPTVAIIQHESDVMQVAHHYFENGIAYFTRRINRCISMACANGEVAPFMGHNAFLRWRAIQDASFVDTVDGVEKIWSESNVSEDFDMALRLMMKGYTIRWATYSKGGFKEGVSLSVDDELNRWQKYAYGCSELLFNPFVEWFRKGPIARQIHRFMWSDAPLHYKISMLAYMFSYYGIAAGITISIINYVLLGFQFPVDGFYIHSFEIWLATTVVFYGSGNVGYSLLEYRLGHKQLWRGFLENLMWIPFFFFFFGGLSIPVSQAILAHLFSYNISWSATIKEVQRSNFFKEIPKIAKRFWFPLSLSVVLIAALVILSTPLVPIEWRVRGQDGWAVIFPVALLSGCHILFPIVLNPWLMVFSY